MFKNYSGLQFKWYNDANVTAHNVLTAYGACTSFGMLRKFVFKFDWMDYVNGFIKKNESEDEWTQDSPEFKSPFDPDQLYKLNIEFPTFVNESCNNGTTYKIIIHPPDEFPTAYHDSFDVPYKENMIIEVKLKSHKSNKNLQILQTDIRKCYYDEEIEMWFFKRYSLYYCWVHCISFDTGCRPIERPTEVRNFRYCWGKTFVNYDDIEFESSFEISRLRACKCYPRCNYLRYNVTLRKEEKNFWTKNDSTTIDVSYISELVEETERFIPYTLANCKII